MSENTGRTIWDMLYSVRRWIVGVILVVVLRRAGLLELARKTLGYYILIPVVIGTGVGVGIGYVITKPRYDFVIKILQFPGVRIRKVRDPQVVVDAMPYISTRGTRIRVAEDVLPTGDSLIVLPHELHRIAIVDPLTAHIHTKALDKVIDELDKTLTALTKTYVRERIKARHLARRRINEVLRYEDELVRKLKEELVEDEEERVWRTRYTKPY